MRAELDEQSVRAGESRRRSLISRLPTLAALGVFVALLSVTAAMTRFELSEIKEQDEQHFDQLVERLRGEVTRRVVVYKHGLMGTRAVFAASNYVDRDEFIRLVGSRQIGIEFPGAVGIGYIENVPAQDGALSAFVAEVRGEGAPWFEVTVPPGAAPLPGSVMDGRQIIKYIEPLERNRTAHGLDIGSHPVRREASERAVVVNDACLTGTIQLVQEDQRMAGFLYMLPFYEHGMPTQTLEQRIAATRGWVYMPMLGPKVFEGVIAAVDGELDVDVFDGGVLSSDTLIYDADGHLSGLVGRVDAESDYAGRAFVTTREIEIGGRTWTLLLSTTPRFVQASRSEAFTLGIGGALLSLLLAALVYVQGSSSRKAWALAEGMTADLREYANKADQATKAKSDFLANMSHEIRTPMTAILGFTDLLRQQIDEDNRDLLEHAQTIKRNGEHLLAVINDILDMSKIEAGKLSVEHIAVDTQRVVGEVVSLMNVKAVEKKLPLSARLTTPVPRQVRTDPVRLRQVLVNLVGNAIKFTDKGSVTIEVRYDEPMQLLKFAVIDTGIGMTDEQVTRLFKAFEQADTTTTREFGGTGLGLHISQRLAKMLGGEIVCNSTFGQGSTFILSIDTGKLENPEMVGPGEIYAVGDRQKARADSASAQSSVDELLGNKPPLTGLRILLAEDGKDNQRLINHHLTKAGAEVKIVDNGLLAVQELCINRDIAGAVHDPPPFDILVTDMQMPEMDGYTAVRLLREKGSTLPIIALTAHAMKEAAEKCLDAGCDLFASKPINKQQLIGLCKKAVVQDTPYAPF